MEVLAWYVKGHFVSSLDACIVNTTLFPVPNDRLFCLQSRRIASFLLDSFDSLSIASDYMTSWPLLFESLFDCRIFDLLCM